MEEFHQIDVANVQLLDDGVANRLSITLDKYPAKIFSLSVLDVVKKFLVLDGVLATRDDVLGGEELDISAR